MKRIAIFVAILVAFLAQGAAVSAQAPDPTGRGRYTIVGGERSVSGAEMVTSLPPGASCAPAGEIAGGRFLNSIGSGKANEIELTSSAEVAVSSDGRQFLCHCGASGKYFNRIFPVASEPPARTVRFGDRDVPVSTPQTQQQTQTQSISVQAGCSFQTFPIQGGKETWWVCGEKREFQNRIMDPIAETSKMEKAPGRGIGWRILEDGLFFGGGLLAGRATKKVRVPVGRNSGITGGSWSPLTGRWQ